MTQAGTIELSSQDREIMMYRIGIDAWCGYAEADARDAQVMLAAQWPYQTYLPRGVQS
jgi:hypothetical protein